MMCYSEEEGSKFIEGEFKRTVVPSLSEFVGIPSCEKGEQANELLTKAGMHIKSWL